jgi:LysM repeat protein
MHKVAEGETLAAIGRQYGASPGGIVSANKLAAGGDPVVGDLLVIPAVYRQPAAATAVTRRTAVRHSPTVRKTTHTPATTTVTTKRKPARPVTHIAQNGQ